jgi:hypothetical protein
MSNHHTEFTCAETSTLWTLYLNNSMSACVLRYFLECVEAQRNKRSGGNGV